MKREELHDILYDLLCAVDDACKKENVPYFLDGGCLLGAVRHKGFIPWDDDVDIFVQSKDYDAVMAALRKHLPSHYRIIEPSELSPHFYDFVPRVQDTRYHWHEPTAEDEFYDNKQNYICVDIFITSNTANTKLGVHLNAFLYKVIYGLGMGHRYQVHDENYTFIQKLQAKFLSTIGKLVPMSAIYRMFQHLVFRKKPNKKYYIPTNYPLPQVGLAYKTEWVSETVELPFRDRKFPAPVGYDPFLTLLYGDYMKPPERLDDYIIHTVCD